MFKSARLKLTAWYLLIIMTISILFSMVIYAQINEELHRFEQFQENIRDRLQEGVPVYLPRRLPASVLDPSLVSDSRVRLQMTLAGINLGILTLSGIAGYFLAGRTLKPIQTMVDEQNRFITDASHEFRTPLTALKTSMEVHLLDREKLPRETVEMIESNLTQVDTLQELSNNLLTLAQYNNNTATKTKLEEVDVYQVIMDAFETVQPLAQKKNIKLTADLEQDLRVKGNAKSLVELSVILLDNAIKYSPENTEVIAAAEQEDHTIKISFKDEGIGIPKEDIPHIFDRFYRSNKSRTKSDVGGYGLGLSIAKKIVDMHKGTILVKSRQDNGTIFSIYLPAYTAK